MYIFLPFLIFVGNGHNVRMLVLFYFVWISHRSFSFAIYARHKTRIVHIVEHRVR